MTILKIRRQRKAGARRQSSRVLEDGEEGSREGCPLPLWLHPAYNTVKGVVESTDGVGLLCDWGLVGDRWRLQKVCMGCVKEELVGHGRSYHPDLVVAGITFLRAQPSLFGIIEVSSALQNKQSRKASQKFHLNDKIIQKQDSLRMLSPRLESSYRAWPLYKKLWIEKTPRRLE